MKMPSETRGAILIAQNGVFGVADYRSSFRFKKIQNGVLKHLIGTIEARKEGTLHGGP